jgi:hypothetical protein
MIHTFFAVRKLFFYEVLSYFQHTFAKDDKDAVYRCYKIPYLDCRARHERYKGTNCDSACVQFAVTETAANQQS